MPSPWGAVTETLSRLNQPVRSWGRGVVSDYVVPPQNRPAPAPPPTERPSYPISPVPPQQLAQQRGFVSPLPSDAYSSPQRPGYETYADFPELPDALSRQILEWLLMDLLGLTDTR